MKLNKSTIIFFTIFLISLLINLKDIPKFLNSENVITGFDAFYYARLSEEILNNEYEKVDYLRDVPDFIERPFPPPLISCIGAFFSSLLKKEYVYAFLPPVLSLAFFIPLFFWIKKFTSVYVFISAALIGSLNTVYYSRTYIGKFDTDFLILFFLFSLLLLFILSLENLYNKRKTVFYVFLSLFLLIIFKWFYPKPIIGLLLLISLLTGYVSFYYRELKKYFKKFILYFSPILLLLSFDVYKGIKSGLEKFHLYFEKIDTSPFLPTNPQSYVTELQPLNLTQLIDATTANPVIFIFSVAGLIWLFVKHFRYISLAAPFIILGILSLKAGNRFVIYLAPFLGMGFGFFMYQIFSYIKRFFKWYWFEYFLVIFLIFFSIPANTLFIKLKPALEDKDFKNSLYFRKILPEKSFIWSWWDYGYPIEYTSRRGTFIDNGNKDLIKMYSIARSLITYNEDEAFKLVSFITNHKKSYYNNFSFNKFRSEVLSYKELPERDVYIPVFRKFLFYQYMYMLGMIGSKEKEFMLPAYKILKKCKKEGKDFLCGKIIKVKDNGDINLLLTGRNINRIVIINDIQRREIPYNKKGRYILQIRIKGKKAYYTLIEKIFFNSIINRMYFLKDNFKHFQLVYDDFPYVVLYKAKR